MRVSLVFAILFLLAVTTMAKKRPSMRDKVTELMTCRKERMALRKSLGKREDVTKGLKDPKAMAEDLAEMFDEAPENNAVEKRRVSQRRKKMSKLAMVNKRIKHCKARIAQMTRLNKQKDK